MTDYSSSSLPSATSSVNSSNSTISSAVATSSPAGSSTVLPSQPTDGPTTVSAITPSVPTADVTYQPPAAPTPTAVAGLSPYTPAGGLDTNSTAPLYRPLSDFDFQSLTLALYQEYIELDLFHHGLAQFSASEFEAAGLSAQDRFLIEFMADQEVAHAELLSNIIGQGVAAQQCEYSYPFDTVRDFIDFSQKLTRFGESGVLGFLQHLDSRASATLLMDSIATESRQQLILRQFEGLFPMPVDTEPSISQSMAWTLLAPYITSCPQNNTRLVWLNFPGLNITNNPNASTLSNLDEDGPAISGHNNSLSAPGYVLNLQWENPGLPVGPNGSYTTNTSAGTPTYVAWISQLNTTYTALNVTGNNTGTTVQPLCAPINGTMFVAITDSNIYVTPHNITQLDPHIVAGPAVYQSG
ncbi:hypothetical protein DICSQDRAFT_51824 [Dichomitus squalens LYAD-421 SS1]|uniref:uncharacterized protein n=1 Tax=Dichomitus squalens (strain LYAD-421) TaxID=732165 RepID=UPI0004413166|nr:uncharacterized protein DICSQDRAFT_51824 [Dichomitus squalens LYAD-421 SS1]EJF65563.1 hypothetical protein DICSQDRAFT_51824 [Dichomitus squalens LYAD-421 SS1]